MIGSVEDRDVVAFRHNAFRHDAKVSARSARSIEFLDEIGSIPEAGKHAAGNSRLAHFQNDGTDAPAFPNKRLVDVDANGGEVFTERSWCE